MARRDQTFGLLSLAAHYFTPGVDSIWDFFK